MKNDDSAVLRENLKKLLSGEGAHVGWKAAFANLAPRIRGARPDSAAHSLWELLEHMRIAQWDILEFSRDPKHVSPEWPQGYWPGDPSPTNGKAWNASLKAFERDLEAMKKLVTNPKTDLFVRIPHGTGQTLFREALLVADHNAYHVGQVISLRRQLGAWKSD
jgi:uncharacterized damage-inducible protein DinB